MNAIKDAFKHYADFKGRTRRKGFWLFILFSFLTSMALGLLDRLLFLDSNVPFEQQSSGPLGIVFSLVIILPTLSISVRRLHDTGRRGWWLLLPVVLLLLWFVLVIMFTQVALSTAGQAMFYVSLTASYIVILVFHVLPSHGDNRFGPAPYPALTSP
ncbi:DUF805 domain-containing protein [Vreelandella sp. EE27]